MHFSITVAWPNTYHYMQSSRFSGPLRPDKSPWLCLSCLSSDQLLPTSWPPLTHTKPTTLWDSVRIAAPTFLHDTFQENYSHSHSGIKLKTHHSKAALTLDSYYSLKYHHYCEYCMKYNVAIVIHYVLSRFVALLSSIWVIHYNVWGKKRITRGIIFFHDCFIK